MLTYSSLIPTAAILAAGFVDNGGLSLSINATSEAGLARSVLAIGAWVDEQLSCLCYAGVAASFCSHSVTGGTPWVVIIDPQGRVVFNDYHVDADGAIAAIRQMAAASKKTQSGEKARSGP